MPTLQVAIPTLHSINAKTVLCLLQALPKVKVRHAIRIFEGMSNLDQARSILLTDWYDSAAEDDLFLFIDSDQTFTAQDINRLIDLGGDVSVGGVATRRPNAINLWPQDEPRFRQGTDSEILYGGTAFMLIRKPILHRAAAFLAEENGAERIWASDVHPRVIPFFRQRLIDRESPGVGPKEWLGEDYAFCWLIRQVGGRLHGLLSKTIGHEIPEVKHVKW